VDMNIYARRAGGAGGVGLTCRLPSAACRKSMPAIDLRFPYGWIRERGLDRDRPRPVFRGRVRARALPHNRLLSAHPRICSTPAHKKTLPPGWRVGYSVPVVYGHSVRETASRPDQFTHPGES
jgi:hypothetical protein